MKDVQGEPGVDLLLRPSPSLTRDTAEWTATRMTARSKSFCSTSHAALPYDPVQKTAIACQFFALRLEANLLHPCTSPHSARSPTNFDSGYGLGTTTSRAYPTRLHCKEFILEQIRGTEANYGYRSRSPRTHAQCGVRLVEACRMLGEQRWAIGLWMRSCRISTLEKLATHSRFYLNLRSQEGDYHPLILFRLTPSQLPETGKDDPSDSPSSLRDQIYVMEAICPHMGADMSHAEIEECDTGVVAVCPWHRFVSPIRFDSFLRIRKSDMTST